MINGILHRYGNFLPQHTAERHPEFTTYHGFTGEYNRQKIASTFLKPTTWKEYCTEVVTEERCASGEDFFATRLPMNEVEEKKYSQIEIDWETYYHHGFTGYFRATNETNCDQNEQCYGHFVNTICSSFTRSEAQMYFNGIPLVSRGEHNGGYTSEEAVEIWYAAGFTQSNLMMLWETPSFMHSYAQGAASFHRVEFPEPSREDCLQFQLNNPLTCSYNQSERVGDDPLAACDYVLENKYRILSSSLKTAYDSSTIEKKSPALEFLSSFTVEMNTMQDLYDDIIEFYVKGVVGNGYAEREAVCQWVYENLDHIIGQSIPHGYPRDIVNVGDNSLHKVARILSFVSICLTIIAAIMIYLFRKKRAIHYAQPIFMAWVIVGKNLYHTY